MKIAGTLLLAGLLSLVRVDAADASSLTIAWNPSADQSVTGYVVSYGTKSGQYSWNIDAGAQTQRVVSGLTDNTVYYFVVKAYTGSGVMSTPSTEISGKVSSTTAATLTTSTSSLSTTSSLTVAWDPSPDPNVSGYLISYGTQSGNYSWNLNVGAQTEGVVTGLSDNTTYYFVVQAYNADGVMSSPSPEVSGVTAAAAPVVVVPTNTPISSVSLIPNLSAPQNVGTTIGWTATVTGGVAPYTYRWWVTSGGTQTALTNWGTSNTYSWKPTVADNTYSMTVCARSAWNTSATPEACNTVPFAIAQSATVTLTANLASPQYVGTAIKFTAAASGGTAPYQYQWWISNGSTTSPATGWGYTNPFTWTPTGVGNYVITVWVRSAGSTVNAPEMTKSMNFSVQRKCRAAKCQP